MYTSDMSILQVLLAAPFLCSDLLFPCKSASCIPIAIPEVIPPHCRAVTLSHSLLSSPAAHSEQSPASAISPDIVPPSPQCPRPPATAPHGWEADADQQPPPAQLLRFYTTPELQCGGMTVHVPAIDVFLKLGRLVLKRATCARHLEQFGNAMSKH